MKVRAKFEVRSFTRSWANRGYFKTLGSPWLRPRSLFCKIFNGLLFAWTLEMHRPNLKSVALPVPEIIGDFKNFGQPLDWIRPRSLLHKIFNGLLFGWTMWMYWPNLKSVALFRSRDNSAYFKTLCSRWIRRSRLFEVTDFLVPIESAYQYMTSY